MTNERTILMVPAAIQSGNAPEESVDESEALEEGTADLFSALAELDEGGVMKEANRAFAELLAAVAARRRPGKVSIEVAVGPHKVDEHGGMVNFQVMAAVKSTLPKSPPAAAIMFRWDTGRVSQHNPKQRRLFPEKG